MVLLEDGGAQSFVNVSTLFVSSSSKYTTAIAGKSDFLYTPPNYLTNVIGMELENYNVPLFALSQFTDRYMLDFRLRNPLIYGGQWKMFSIQFPRTTFLYHIPESRAADLLSILYGAFREKLLQDPDFGGKADIVPIADPNTLVTLICRTLVYPGFVASRDSTECEFLFGTGPNRALSVAPIFGFDEVDIAFTKISYYGTPARAVQSSRAAGINLYRFLDVFIDEFSLDEPFARIFLPAIQSVMLTSPETGSRMRLLRKPITKTNSLTFRLRLAGNVRPQTSLPFYFNIKLFTLNRSISLPAFEELRHQSL